MYVCSRCGHQKSVLSSAPDYELRRRCQAGHCERCIEGMSDQCSVCKELTFFFRTGESEKTRTDLPEQEPRGNALDNSGTNRRNDDDKPDDRMLQWARQNTVYGPRGERNWATQAVEPPSGKQFAADSRKHPAMLGQREEHSMTYSAYHTQATPRMAYMDARRQQGRSNSDQRHQQAASGSAVKRRAASMARNRQLSPAEFKRQAVRLGHGTDASNPITQKPQPWNLMTNTDTTDGAMSSPATPSSSPQPAQASRNPYVRSYMDKKQVKLSSVPLGSQYKQNADLAWERNELTQDQPTGPQQPPQKAARDNQWAIDHNTIPMSRMRELDARPKPLGSLKEAVHRKKHELIHSSRPTLPAVRLTRNEAKMLQRLYTSEEQSGPETSRQFLMRAKKQQKHLRRTGGSVQAQPEPAVLVDELQLELKHKEQRMTELYMMRQHIEQECERTKKELFELQCQKQMMAESELRHQDERDGLEPPRECGGHCLSGIKYMDSVQLDELIERKERQTDTLDEKLHSLLHTIQEIKQTPVPTDVQPAKMEPQLQEAEVPTHEDLLEPESSNGEQDSDTEEFESHTEPISSNVVVTKAVTSTASKPRMTRLPLPPKLNVRKGMQSLNVYRSSLYFVPGTFFGEIHSAHPVCYKKGNIKDLVSQVQRAVFRGSVQVPKQIGLCTVARKSPPPANFQTVSCASHELHIMLELKPEALKESRPRELNISRMPIHCPDADCGCLTFISDFNKHLMHDHRALTLERINVRQTKTFLLDTHVTLLNRPKCHMLYLVKNKVYDTHSNELQDLLPVMVMTARVNMSEVFGKADQPLSSDTSPSKLMFVIWLTTLMPIDMAIMGTVSIWPTCKEMPDSVFVHTSNICDICEAKDLKSICRSSCSLMVHDKIVQRMTHKGREFIGVQVQIY